MVTDSTDDVFIYSCSAPGCMQAVGTQSKEGVISDNDSIKGFYKSLLGNSSQGSSAADKKKPNLIQNIMKKKSA